MAKKKNSIVFNETIIEQPLEEVMHNSMIPYAEYVVMERALPRVEDGLKPVQRRILYTMMELSNTPDKPHKKSARITGDTMGKYHPHGDTSIYDAMVRLSQDFSVRAPLVDGHGNFGSIDGDSAAAMRYTEVRMAPLALQLLRDIEKDTVPFRLNFDDSLKEPSVLPGRFPNLLVNGSMGIAVGLATNIPSHNLGEVIDAVVLRMDKPKTKLEDIMEVLPAPDFPTGGYLVGRDGLVDAYTTGKGKISIRSKCTLEKANGGKTNIIISEVPYQVNKANMLEKILRLRESRKGILNDITDIRDESDREGIRAVIEIKKDGDANKVLAYLYKYSDLQINYGINMVAIANGKPQQLGLLPIIDYYIDHQKDVVTRRTRYDLERAEAREHILEGLLVAINNIDEVIRIIKSSGSTQEAKRNLMRAFNLTGVQSQAILDMRLARLTALEVEKLIEELERVRALIAELKSILRSPRKLRSVIRKEILEIKKKYADKRRTVILDEAKLKSFTAEDFIVVEDIVVTVTKEGFVKRLTKKTYSRSNTDAPVDDLNKQDAVVSVHSGTTKDILYVFTANGIMYQLPADDISEARWAQKGTHLSAVLKGFDANQRVIGTFLLKSMPQDKHLLFVSKSGMSKRTSTDQYQTRNKRFVACGVAKDDSLVSVTMCKRGRTITMVTHNAMSLTVRPTQISVMGRTAKGMRIMTLSKDDFILASFETDGEGDMLLLTDAGYGKRIMTLSLTAKNKATKGSAVIKFNKNMSNGSCIIHACVVKGKTDIYITQKSGLVTKEATDTFPMQTDAGRGAPIVPVVLGDDIESCKVIVSSDTQ